MEYKHKFLDLKEGDPIPKFIDNPEPEIDDVPPVFVQASKLKICDKVASQPCSQKIEKVE